MIILIPIPEHSKCSLKNGQNIDIGDPYIEFFTQSLIDIPLAKKLKIPPASIFKYIKKFVGESLKKSEVLAIKKGFFSSTKILSEYDGIIKEIDHNNGQLIIEVEGSDKKKVPSYFKGEIISISKNEIQLKVKSGKEYDLKNSVGDFGGKTMYLTNSDVNSITAECSTSICIAESLTSYIQSKTEALGVDGFVTLNSLPEKTNLPAALFKQIQDLKKVFEYKLPYCIVNGKKGTITFYQ